MANLALTGPLTHCCTELGNVKAEKYRLCEVTIMTVNICLWDWLCFGLSALGWIACVLFRQFHQHDSVTSVHVDPETAWGAYPKGS
jgi:hypothetical protein